MLPRFWNRPEPKLDQQPYALEHLQDVGRAVPKRILSNDAYGALLTVAASRVVIADAYTHGGPKGEWVIEVHGAYEWQECRWQPRQWEAFYRRHLDSLYHTGELTGRAWIGICAEIARLYPNGRLASTVDLDATVADGGAA